MKTLLLTLAIVTSLISVGLAGGGHFEAEIVALTSKGNEEYRLELTQYSLAYVPTKGMKPKRIVIHLRLKDDLFGKNPPRYATIEEYRKAIASLQKQAKVGGRFKFGIMASGYKKIEGKKNEFQSNALAIQEEHGGNRVVYSFAKKI